MWFRVAVSNTLGPLGFCATVLFRCHVHTDGARRGLRPTLRRLGRQLARHVHRLAGGGEGELAQVKSLRAFALLGVSLLSSTASSAAAASSFSWRSQRIPDSVMRGHQADLDFVRKLVSLTLVCPACGRRNIIDQRVGGIEYCNCQNRVSSVYGVENASTAWTPFLERPNILVWRQEHPVGSGLYAYKMYGRFDDVTAAEFVEVQLDMSEFRQSWDENTAQCHVLEEDVEESGLSLSQIYYWEVNWPRFFSNRDYVCNRRAHIFEEDNVAVIYSKSVTHPTCPKKVRNFRVEDYWSAMTVKPIGDWNECGVEFSLTAFENPGLSLPASITTWVAIRAMPEFMQNLRLACIQHRKWKQQRPEGRGAAEGAASKKAKAEAEPSYMHNLVTSSSSSLSGVKERYDQNLSSESKQPL